MWDTLSPTLPSVGLGAACPTLGSVGLSVGQEWATLRSVGHFGPHYLVHTCPTLGFAVFNGVSERFQNLITTQDCTCRCPNDETRFLARPLLL